MWVRVNPHNGFESRRFHIIGTGHSVVIDVDPDGMENIKYLSTVQQGRFVWHVFEEVQ